MKKNLLILFAVFVSCSYPLYSQLGSPILVLPPEQANFQPTAITLDWEDVTNATGYLVDISTTPIFPAYPADSVMKFVLHSSLNADAYFSEAQSNLTAKVFVGKQSLLKQ